eukprot:s3848_g1.t1
MSSSSAFWAQLHDDPTMATSLMMTCRSEQLVVVSGGERQAGSVFLEFSGETFAGPGVFSPSLVKRWDSWDVMVGGCSQATTVAEVVNFAKAYVEKRRMSWYAKAYVESVRYKGRNMMNSGSSRLVDFDLALHGPISERTITIHFKVPTIEDAFFYSRR